MTIATVAELRLLHIVGSRSNIIHHPTCGQAKRIRSDAVWRIGDDERYWAGELRPGECCSPIVPRPDAPADEPGWKHT